jgi:hypothetical protein
VLPGLPKGAVEVYVTNYPVDQVQVYVQGALGITPPLYDGTVTFEDVADLGPGVLQPAVGIDGGYRTLTSPPLADVLPGATVPGGELIGPLLDFLDRTDEEHADGQLATVVLPEFVPARWWHGFFHNQTAWLIKAALLYRRRHLGFQRAIVDVPYHLSR